MSVPTGPVAFRQSKTLKKLAALAAFAVVAVSACGSPESTLEPAGATASVSDPALAALGGKIVFGTEGTYAPFTYHDPSTNELVGYDIEVAKAVAERLGLTPEFQETTWDAMFAALEADRFDVIANQVAITDERQQKYDLSDPYAVSYPVVLTRAGDGAIKTIADLKGKTAAQASGSNWAAQAESYGAVVESVPGFAEAAVAVKRGRVDFTLNDALTVADYFKTTADSELEAALEITGEKGYCGLALLKDSGLLPAFNQVIAELTADGTLARIGQKYFGKDISI
ncbi:MAG: transporter substrate-binding domain-containing protein [Bifidobacteriaceae bacterium]|jgi:ABC-type amino acid transport substrate-binding protein|nr:transporter substrate-binding domain-containing protein [Bifidobacteriaceae bacterium]